MGPISIRIVLEKGAALTGQAWGDFSNPRSGEFVFCTATTGMEESLTDPSFSRQIIVSTTSHVGNTGYTGEDKEHSKIWAEGLVCRKLTPKPSSWRSQKSLKDWIVDEKRFVVEGIDTRQLTLHLRDHGSQRALLFEEGAMTDKEALQYIQEKVPSMEGAELVSDVTRAEESVFKLKKEYWPLREVLPQKYVGKKILLWDLGAKENMARILDALGAEVTLLPAKISSDDILKHSADALLLSNGPGDPATVSYVLTELKKLLGKMPVYGICLGHQMIAQALGAKTFKMKFGHRGIHHPVNECNQEGEVLRTWITSQNHGFVVDEKTLPKNAFVKYRHANDGSVEGLSVPELNCASVQFHPEAAPGTFDSVEFFIDFLGKLD